jgi:hypothetical protein
MVDFPAMKAVFVHPSPDGGRLELGDAPGDHVMSMAGGSYAERVAVDALTTGGGLRRGDAVVIHAAASAAWRRTGGS